MRAKILIFFYKCYKCFGKRGEVTLKMSRRFFVFCTKNKMFCTNFRANKLRNFFFSHNKIDAAS